MCLKGIAWGVLGWIYLALECQISGFWEYSNEIPEYSNEIQV